MPSRVSRRKIASYAADKLVGGANSSDVIREVAALLVALRRTRELDLLVRDIEGELAARGIVVADITSARALNAEARKQIGDLVGANEFTLRETIDPDVLGGVRIDIPGSRYDGTLRRKLQSLYQAKL